MSEEDHFLPIQKLINYREQKLFEEIRQVEKISKIQFLYIFQKSINIRYLPI